MSQKVTSQRLRREESAEAEADLEDEEQEASPRFNEDEDEASDGRCQEGQRRVINVNKMPHLQSNKNHRIWQEQRDKTSEEDIIPSVSSARNTHRRANLSQVKNKLEKSRSVAMLAEMQIKGRRAASTANRGAGPKNLFNIVQAPLLLQGHQGNAEENLNYSGELLLSGSSPILLTEAPDNLNGAIGSEPKATVVKKQHYSSQPSKSLIAYTQSSQHPYAPITRASQVPKLKENKGSSGKIKPKLDFSFDGDRQEDDEEEDKSDNERNRDLN